MNWDDVVSVTAITAGAVVMAASVVRFSPILDTIQFIQAKERRVLERFLKIHRALMGFFLLGYLVVLLGVVFDAPLLSNLLIGAIFFFGALFVYITVTLQRRMLRGVLNQAAANLKRQQAEERTEAKSRFLAHMSHEIRTPMNAILGYAQLLQRETGLSPRQQEHLETISRSGQHLLFLINDVLDMAKIEAGQITLSEEQVNLSEMIVDLERMFHLRAAAKGLAFRVVVEEGFPAAVKTDAGKVRQVLINLLSNAFKFTSEGEVTLALNASVADGDTRRIVALVTDTGTGIESDQLETVFGAFKQASQTTTKTGTGLGLAVSRRFAKLLDGDLTVTSNFGQGSEFRFEFTAKPSDAAKVVEAEAPVVGLMPNSKVAKVLVVDDQADNRNLLCAMLRTIGLTVRAASSGEDALDALGAEAFDLMLLDLRMPGMDGFEVVDRVRNDEATARLPIVIVSASALEDEQRVAVARGADGFLSKPVNEGALFAMIQRLTGVQYRRASHQMETTSSDGDASERGLVRAVLPAELATALSAAARRGDIAAIDKHVAQAAEHDQATGQRLKELADSFDYEALVRELESAVQS